MKRLIVLSTVLLVSPVWADGEKLGKVHFKVECNEAAQAEFNVAMAYYHSFAWSEMQAPLERVTKADPSCGMAHWARALASLNNPFTWPTIISAATLAEGPRILQDAERTGLKSKRERDYVEALGAFFADQDKLDHKARAKALEVALEQLARRYPRDEEAATLYALVLSANFDPADKKYTNQLKAAKILDKVFLNQPDHPGAAHYLIHSYDYPPIAKKGLEAARRYSNIAPDAPHALHMPSHIFTRLGMWDESIAANQASAEASRAYAAMRHRDAAEAEELHALDYLAYSYLQEAQDAEAKKIVDLAAKVKKTNPEFEFSAAYALAAIPTRYAFERNDWATAANLSIPNVPHWSSFPFMEALIEYGHALGRAHTGDVEGARKAIARMQELRDATKDPKFDYFKSHLDQQMQAATAWVAAAEGKKNDAIDILRRAADSEDILGKHPVSPGAFVPIREQLGTLLLEVEQPSEAQRQFEAALKIYPGRFRGLYGAAKAAELAGDKDSANRYYTKLAAQTSKAGGSRDELNHVREFLTAQAKTGDPKAVTSARE